MNTNAYWQFRCEYTRDDNSTGALVGGCPENTLQSALSAGFEGATYYLVDCGYPSAVIEAEQYCKACQGVGEIAIRRPRSTRTVKCKSCRGHHGPLQTSGEIPVKLHDNARERLAGAR